MRNKNLRKTDFIKIFFIFGFVATFTFLALRLPSGTSAARGEFKAGNIISDYMMSKSDSMTVEEIDAFLHEKGNCYNTQTYMASWYPTVHYHVEGDHFVCLADERFAASGTNFGDLLADGEASQTAAEIIYEVAQEYKINPQVLIVLLEKEQGLISDSWPNSLQYRSATGYGCPDTAACDSKYYGFKNQLKNAASLFRTVLNGGWTNYPLGENFIYYNPNRDCGGSTVNIENLATSALYRYTPYQPNAAALSVGYGTAYCGAYGNRNFFYLFSDWFGDPTTTDNTKQIKLEEIEDVNLENGVYNIFYSGDEPKAITVENSSKSNEANVQSVNFSASDKSSRWKIEKTEDGYYIIVNENSGKALDISDGTFANKTNVQQYTLNETCAQQWMIGKGTDGRVVIHNYCYPSFALDLQNGDKNIQIYKKTIYVNDHQEWKISLAKEIEPEKDWSGNYNIKYFDNKNKALSVASSEDYANAEIKTFSSSDKTEQWLIEKQDGYYTIKNQKTGMLLDVANGIFENKRNLWQHSQNLTCAQRWNFAENADGSIIIYNACNPEFVLDVHNGVSNVQIYSKVGGSGNSHQRWILEEVNNVEDFSGIYNILYSGDTNKAIGINGDNIEVAATDKTKNSQKWSIEKQEDYYLIKNLVSEKVFDVFGGVFQNKTNIWQYPSNNSCAQQWIIERNSDDSVLIKNYCNQNFVLDLQDGNTNLQIYSKTEYENKHQNWILQKIEFDKFTGEFNIIYADNKNKALSVASSEDYANAEIKTFSSSDKTEQWLIEKQDGYYTIKNQKTGMLLDVANGIFENKRNLWQHSQNLTCAQRWNFAENADGSIIIYNACNPEFVLDVHNGVSNVQIYSKVGGSGNSHQRWILQAIW